MSKSGSVGLRNATRTGQRFRIGSLILVALSLTADNLLPSGAGVIAVARAATPAPSAIPRLLQAAELVGIKRCLPAIAATARRVTAGSSRHDILFDWYRPAPDRGPSFSLTALQFGDQTIAFSLVAMPGEGDRCSLLAERISFAPQTCASLAQAELTGQTAAMLLPGVMVYATPARPAETTTTIDRGQGCLVIRRQAGFDLGAQR